MATFHYQARDGQGQAANGFVNAATLDEAGRMLRGEGKFIIKLMPTAQGAAAAGPATATETARVAVDRSAPPGGSSPRVRRTDVIIFAHQLAVMVETGVPLSESLDCIAAQTPHLGLQAVLRDVAAHVQSGGEFSAALRKHPRAFPTLMVSLIRASEVSGTMGTMLERIARYMSREHQIIRQARGALMYPMFMVCMATAVTIFLLGFVLPKFTKIYASRGAALPAPTRALMAIGNGLTAYWYIWLVLVVGTGVGLYIFKRTHSGRRTFDWVKLHTPVLRRVFTQFYISRACRTMGTMIAAGVPLLDIIPIVKQVTDNAYFDDLWDAIDQRLRQGSQLAEPFFNTRLVPRSIAQMIFSGERSGRLGQVMNRVADFAEEEFDLVVKTTTQFIEPVMIGVMGAIIGFIAIALLLPIFTVGNVIAKG